MRAVFGRKCDVLQDDIGNLLKAETVDPRYFDDMPIEVENCQLFKEIHPAHEMPEHLCEILPHCRSDRYTSRGTRRAYEQQPLVMAGCGTHEALAVQSRKFRFFCHILLFAH